MAKRADRVDLAVAAALAVWGQLEVWLPGVMPGVDAAAHRGLLAAVALLATLPVAVRRRHPITAIGMTTLAVSVAELGASQDALAPFAAMLLEAFALGAYARLEAGLVTFAAVVAVIAAGDPNNAVFVALVIGVPFGAGRVSRRLRDQAQRLERLSAQLADEQERSAQLAVELERQRVARELHDVIGHGLGVMVLQAGAVRRLLRPDQQDERAALESAERTGREALAELRRVVGGLRGDESASPPAGLGALDRLAEQVEAAGLPVHVRVSGAPRPLPAVLDHSAYRVVQEALTNALKHAGPARADVVVRFDHGWLDLTVTDDGRGADDRDGAPAGYGLVGMRERAALFGGELEAGPSAAGGFSVHARFPLPASPFACSSPTTRP
jgi:signal transduction histidine kinase